MNGIRQSPRIAAVSFGIHSHEFRAAAFERLPDFCDCSQLHICRYWELICCSLRQSAFEKMAHLFKSMNNQRLRIRIMQTCSRMVNRKNRNAFPPATFVRKTVYLVQIAVLSEKILRCECTERDYKLRLSICDFLYQTRLEEFNLFFSWIAVGVRMDRDQVVDTYFVPPQVRQWEIESVQLAAGLALKCESGFILFVTGTFSDEEYITRLRTGTLNYAVGKPFECMLNLQAVIIALQFALSGDARIVQCHICLVLQLVIYKTAPVNY